MATYATFQGFAVDFAGNVLPNAAVTVTRESDSGIATIFSSRTGAGLANPFNADGNGFFSFFAAGGAYRIDVAFGSTTRTFRYVAIGTMAELDVGGINIREALVANRTYYVRSDGNDSNNGLANSSVGAFLTVQKAISVVIGTLDSAGFTVTIKLATSSTFAGASISSPMLGGGSLVIDGNGVSATIAGSSADAILAQNYAAITVSNVTLTASGGTVRCLHGKAGAVINLGAGIIFGAASQHMYVEQNAVINTNSQAYSVTGNATNHMFADMAGVIDSHGSTVTIGSALAFTAFAKATKTGVLNSQSMTFSGAGVAGTTGLRFALLTEGVIYTSNAGPNYFPGSSLGTNDGTGVYDVGYRYLLSADTTFYVRTDGSDSNNGLANSAVGAFATWNGAYNYLCTRVDFNGKNVTLQIVDGTYTGGLSIAQSWVGGGTLTIQGNAGTPSNVLVSVNGVDCVRVTCQLSGILNVQNFKVQSAGSVLGRGLVAGNRAIFYATNIVFGAVISTAAHMHADNGSIYITGNYSIVGAAWVHYEAVYQGQIRVAPGVTVTLTGTPAFTAFAYAYGLGDIPAQLVTFSGAATGARYLVTSNGVIDTGGGGATYFPGDAGGSVYTGGQYL